jgi:hypothetical protein
MLADQEAALSYIFLQNGDELARSLNFAPSYLENDSQQSTSFTNYTVSPKPLVHDVLKESLTRPLKDLLLTLMRRFRSLKVWYIISPMMQIPN